MTKILTFLADFIGIKALKLSIVAFYFVLVFAFYTFVMASIVYFYNVVSDLLHYVSADVSSTALAKFWGLLHCMGVIDGFIVGFPMLTSALVFFFTILLFKSAFEIKGRIIDFTMKALN